MKLIKLGSTGNDVKKWQYFLTGQGLYKKEISGVFTTDVDIATKQFQLSQGLNPDGKVGNYTAGAAMLLGFGLIIDTFADITSDAFPAKPKFEPILGNAEKMRHFGEIKYKSDPLPDNPENIKITNDWDKQNIILVQVPQLIAIKGSAKVYFHRLAAAQLTRLFQAWQDQGLMHHILSWDGAYNPRFVRGSRKSLSNHTFGTAFDINYSWNKLGAVPALVGQKGSVRELVAIAHQHGFYWGGHFSRRDGMHFEVARVMK